MKIPTLKIAVASFIAFAALLAGLSATSLAADGEGLPPVLCNLWPENQYGRANQSTQQAMELYHETINKKFNEYIKKMIAGQAEASKNAVSDPNAAAPEDGVCTAENYSTYCVARAMLIGEGVGGRDGYMDYLKALECRRSRIFDTIDDETAWKDYQDFWILGEGNEQAAFETLQTQRTLSVSARVEKIDAEIVNSKKALDVALATYDELKTSWTMHKRFMNIYKNLIKFRDKMAEVRHQVEEFPSKFIDATTTKCT